MCQMAQGLKIVQNCIMSQKCIVYNKRVEFIVYNKEWNFLCIINEWNFCTRFKTSNIWWQQQTVISLSGELIAQWFTPVFVLVQSQSIVGTNSGTLCVLMLEGGLIDWEWNSQGTCYSSSTHSVLVLYLICFDTFLFNNSCFPELSLSIYGHVIQEL